MSLTNYICNTCGVQYEASSLPPEHCPVCEDDRQYLGAAGQTWTSLPVLNRQHKNVIELVAPDVFAIYSTPQLCH